MGQNTAGLLARVRKQIGIATLVGATCCGVVASTVTGAGAAPAPQAASVSGAAARAVDPLAGIAATALTELQTWVRTGATVDLDAYAATRDAIALEIAGRLTIDPAQMAAAWARADVPHQTALLAAVTQLGVPYRRNTSKPGVSFDCSGLTTYAWSVAGVAITRQSAAQIKAAAPRTQDTAQAGDLMYYPGHAMMYLGVDRAMIHSPYTGKTVEVDLLSKKRTPRFGNPIG